MLKFNVIGQQILRVEGTHVVADSYNYLRASFEFSDDWEGVVKTAIFKNGANTFSVLLDENNECIVPHETLIEGLLDVSVFGVIDNELITTDVAQIRVLKSGYTEGQTPLPPTPSVYEQITAILNNLSGGETNKVLAKASDADYDFKYVANQGGGGTNDYNNLENQPEINGVTLSGNKTSEDLGLANSTDVYTKTEADELLGAKANSSTLSSHIDDTDIHVTTSEKDVWDGKSVVSANPTLEGSETTLSGLEINGTKYSVPQGGGEVEVDADIELKSVAHRGYNVIAPENTLPAYVEAYKKNFDCAECDVEFTSDNVPVILHDDSINRTSNGSGYIYEMTFAQVRTYDFGSWKSPVYAGTKIPSFEEYIKLCRDLKLKPYIELKNTRWASSKATSCMNIVKKYRMERVVTWISFSSIALADIKALDSKARLGFIPQSYTNTSDIVNTIKSLRSGENDVFLDGKSSSVNKSSFINLMKTNNIPLEVWTVDTENEALSLDGYITGVTSNAININALLKEKALEEYSPTQKHTLTFDVNDGQPISPVIEDEGTVIDLSNYTTSRSGYTFDGWYSDSGLTTLVTSVTLDADKTVYAKWNESTVTQYTLTFDVDGGQSISPVTVDEGTVINLSNYTTSKSGYSFDGWYSESTFETLVTTVTLNSDTTVYAKWEESTETEIPLSGWEEGFLGIMNSSSAEVVQPTGKGEMYTSNLTPVSVGENYRLEISFPAGSDHSEDFWTSINTFKASTIAYKNAVEIGKDSSSRSAKRYLCTKDPANYAILLIDHLTNGKLIANFTIPNGVTYIGISSRWLVNNTSNVHLYKLAE